MSARPTLFRWLLPALLALALPSLEGCGKKPKLLDPPEGSPPSAADFPHSYPNTKYDSVPPSRRVTPAVQPGPMTPGGAYPAIVLPHDLSDPSTLPMPGQGGGGEWSNRSGSQP